MCSRAVRAAFFKLFSDGLIYRGKRLVNWDTHLQTAVADDEVFEEETQGSFWTFHYPVVDAAGADTKRSIKFSTTRPETMLGDVAVCVHPSDERYIDLVGEQVRVPLTGRLVPIIADALLADPEKGTGAVKVTPAHDPNDYACGLRNGLEMLNVLNLDGTMNAEAGTFAGLDRLDARGKIVEAMDELGIFRRRRRSGDPAQALRPLQDAGRTAAERSVVRPHGTVRKFPRRQSRRRGPRPVGDRRR